MKSLFRILTVTILAAMDLAAFAYDFEVDKIYYSILSDTECGVAGSNGTLTNVIIPEKVYGYTVTEVIGGPKAKTVSLPSTLKKIHYTAFDGIDTLESIDIPDGVDYIGMNAFSNCKNLTSISLPASLQVLEEGCFLGCTNLQNITFPVNLKEIRTGALGSASSNNMVPWLTNQPNGAIYINDIFVSYNGDPTKIVIREGTKSIASEAFARTQNVEDIVIPSSVETIGEFAFNGTKWLSKQSLPLYINNVLVLADNTENYIIPSYVTAIAGNAFYNKSSLKSVNIPNSVKYIGRCAFYGCTSLTTVEIPESVVVIGRSPFGNCSGLTTIDVEENNPAYCSYNGLLYNHDCDSLIQYPGGKAYSQAYNQPKDLLSDKTRYVCFDAISYSTMGYRARYFPKTLSYIDGYNFGGGKISVLIFPCRANGAIGYINIENTQYDNFRMYNYSTRHTSVSKSDIVIDNTLNAEVYNRINTSLTYSSASSVLQNSYLPNSIVLIKDNPTENLVNSLPDSHFFKIDGNWSAINYRMLDGEPFYCPEQMNTSKVTYTREFNNDEWQALFLPYSMSYDEWKDFGEVAELSNVGLNAANEPILIWQRITEGELLPNHPYIFKPNETGEIVFSGENKTIKSTNNCDVVSFTADGISYSLTGTYQEKTNMATTHAYALSSGDFRPTNSNAKTLKPFRIYLTINSGSQKAPQRVCNIIADDNDLSGIQIITNTLDQESSYYDLMGRKVDNPSKGIYIQNNKKVIIK